MPLAAVTTAEVNLGQHRRSQWTCRLAMVSCASGSAGAWPGPALLVPDNLEQIEGADAAVATLLREGRAWWCWRLRADRCI